MIREEDFPRLDDEPDQGTGQAVVALIRDHRGRHLLQLRDAFDHVPGGGTWSLFGGAVEQGEDLGAALSRELEEELGINAPAEAFSPFCWLRGFSDRRPKVFVLTCDKPVEPDQITLGEGAGFAFFTDAQCQNLEQSPLLKRVFPAYFKKSR